MRIDGSPGLSPNHLAAGDDLQHSSRARRYDSPEMLLYTDPGSGALIWQALAAGFVGLLFYVRKLTSWFRAKK